ncbi:MAG: hypothetical protein JEZ07_11990 [Phycisphaerae bacterium]|nr:hypothetical protein [Phycisphaerae bacterium]
MKNLFMSLLLLALTISFAGCHAIGTRVYSKGDYAKMVKDPKQADVEQYPIFLGTQQAWYNTNKSFEPDRERNFKFVSIGILSAIDIPFSFVGDVFMLPLDFGLYYNTKRIQDKAERENPASLRGMWLQ